MLPYFYIPSFDKSCTEILLDEDNSRHIVQVLRMQQGERLQLTDGAGHLLTATILDDHKKKCRVRIDDSAWQPAGEKKVTIAISLLKNASRFEWFLEKATEIGVSGIIPLLCERTERQQFRETRLQGILISAMLQSQQCWLPSLHTPLKLAELLATATHEKRFIAHCLEVPRPTLSLAAAEPAGAAPVNDGDVASTLILIGPEGDFSPKEVELSLQQQFVPVTLGDTRLRTETAGMVAAALLCIR